MVHVGGECGYVWWYVGVCGWVCVYMCGEYVCVWGVCVVVCVVCEYVW